MTIDDKLERIKNLITIESGVDITDRSRERDIVEMRAVYYKILRDVHHFSLTRIAKSIGYNHATVLHALNNYDAWSSFSNNMVTCYNNVKEIISNDENQDSVYEDVMALRRRIEMLELSNQQLTMVIVKNLRGKRETLHDLIMEIPEDKIKKAYLRLDALISCL
jgi:hypothetical protein